MVKHNLTYGNVIIHTAIELGKGDTVVAVGISTNHVTVNFFNDKLGKIGRDHPEYHGKTTNEMPPDAMLIFNEKESIDVLIKVLEEAKENFPV